jgi:hypothetical protein
MALFDPWELKPTSPLIEDLEVLRTYYQRKNSWIAGYIWQPSKRSLGSRCLLGAIDTIHTNVTQRAMAEYLIGREKDPYLQETDFDICTSVVTKQLRLCPKSTAVVQALAEQIVRLETTKNFNERLHEIEDYILDLEVRADVAKLTLNEYLNDNVIDAESAADIIYIWNDDQINKSSITRLIKATIKHERKKLTTHSYVMA